MLFLSAPVYTIIYIYIMCKRDTRDMMEMHKDKQNIFITYVTFLISCSLIG